MCTSGSVKKAFSEKSRRSPTVWPYSIEPRWTCILGPGSFEIPVRCVVLRDAYFLIYVDQVRQASPGKWYVEDAGDA